MEFSRLTQLVSIDLSYNYFLKLESPNLKTLVGNLTYLDDVNIYLKNGSERCWALSSSLADLANMSFHLWFSHFRTEFAVITSSLVSYSVNF